LRQTRVFWFIVCILIGLVGGLVYGWWGNPTLPVNTSLPQLRSDYKTDYVLMTAEIFRTDKDPASAAVRLLALDPHDPLSPVQDAIVTAQQNGFNNTDVTLLADLASAMLAWQSVPTVVNR
jgi:hypothetical protein